MNKNTVKSGLTRTRTKRAKRSVETTEFDAFVRRILRAYARRVAAGDIEALRSLAVLSTEVDAVTRLAVTGLRQPPYRYSWSEIADRLGVSRQAVQMRYGDRADRVALDERMIRAGLGVTVATLAQVFADHHPGSPASSLCPGCGFRYPDGVTDCPTNATVRPLLYRRRGEDKQALNVLTPDQLADLHNLKTARTNRTATRRAAQPTPPASREEPTLFGLADRRATA
ncbi:hypothetical protein AB0I37_11015 [Micromonospora purpureochromogenes]|uniref:hypothetical protein n=1 Tax=Micromonospora purpureochromogenes TaxID=47872 RepID=UPI003408B755